MPRVVEHPVPYWSDEGPLAFFAALTREDAEVAKRVIGNLERRLREARKELEKKP